MIDLEYIKSILDRMKDLEFKASKEYQTVDGHEVPRVTEILSQMLHEDYLMNWANSLGFKHIGYRSYMKEAADKGTYSHLAIERFLKTKEIPSFMDTKEYPLKVQSVVYNTFHGFLKWWEEINKYHKVEIVFSEKKLVHQYFGGTCDCVLKIDDRYWLIDFKTSNHMNYKYTLQLAAYKYLLKELKDIDIGGCIVLILNKSLCSYNEYHLDLSNPDHNEYMNNCVEEFLILAAAYRMRIYTENQYKNIFSDVL